MGNHPTYMHVNNLQMICKCLWKKIFIFHTFLLFTSIHCAPDLVFIYLILQLL